MGKMYFDFTVSFQNQELSPEFLTGKFETFILTPDNRRFNGPTIDASTPPSGFEIIVKGPILQGPYTIVVRNINVIFANRLPFVGSFIDPSVTVRNSFNKRISSTYLQSQNLMNFPVPLNNQFARAQREFLYQRQRLFLNK